jgi:chromate transport protein ChrA
MITPALLIVPLIHFAGKRATHPRLRSMMKSVVLASAGLLWVSSIPLMREAVRDPLTIIILLVTVVLLVMRKLDSLWIILGASALELAEASTHLSSGLKSSALIRAWTLLLTSPRIFRTSSAGNPSGSCRRSHLKPLAVL